MPSNAKDLCQQKQLLSSYTTVHLKMSNSLSVWPTWFNHTCAPKSSNFAWLWGIELSWAMYFHVDVHCRKSRGKESLEYLLQISRGDTQLSRSQLRRSLFNVPDIREANPIVGLHRSVFHPRCSCIGAKVQGRTCINASRIIQYHPISIWQAISHDLPCLRLPKHGVIWHTPVDIENEMGCQTRASTGMLHTPRPKWPVRMHAKRTG